jgi:hypothetical protein
MVILLYVLRFYVVGSAVGYMKGLIRQEVSNDTP